MEPGDPGAFCQEIRGRLVGTLTLYCSDREVAEELAQEALTRTWQRWARVGRMDAPEAYTTRTAINLANSWYRRRLAERRARDRSGGVAAAGRWPDGDVVATVRQAVRSLPKRQRAVVIARFYLELSVDETASLLGCAPGTVKATTHQALARLRDSGLVDDEEVEVESR
ncbi:MAG: sigma-70 family RNA polymerase sigma factor [Actinomycetota bacterium]|nr:sigma-70 family RNA polymerase sigma factor [Actinomycetota bacterium]